MDSLALILIFGCCFISVMIIGVIVAVNYDRRVVKPQVEVIPQQLAEQMGLVALDPQKRYRYGGTHQDHTFHIDLDRTGTRTMSGSGSTGQALAVSVDVQMKKPQQGYAYCNRGHVSSTTNFETAFRAKLKYEWLSLPARDVMLAFVRKHDNLYLEGLPIRPKPQTQLETKVRVQHNIGHMAQITPSHVQTVLDELIEIARVIETIY